MSTKKHILFSVAGMSPAIITETLFGLWESKVTGGEIHLLTTSHGKTSMQVLLSEKGQIAAFNRMYKTSWEIRPAWIETLRDPHSNQPLKDLRSFADNENAANAIVERVHHWTQQANIVLHASIAGGRKTMGIYLTQAMSWFARSDDDLSHVLVPESFEKDRQFYFPDKASHQKIVDFAKVPFVRMHGLLPSLLNKKEQTYSDRVKLSEVYLKDISNQAGDLRLDLDKRTLSIDGYKLAQLQPLNVGLYLFLIEHANLAKGQGEFFLKRAFEYRYELIECLKRAEINKSKSGLSSLVFLHQEKWPTYWKELGGYDHIEARKSDLNSAFGKLNTDFKGIWENATFRVFKAGDKKKEGPCRWVDIASDRIQIIE
jgi:CRISPR-associated protein (TIGR02584 family)